MRIVALVIVALAVMAWGQIRIPLPSKGVPPLDLPITAPRPRTGSISGQVLSNEKKPLGNAVVFLQKASSLGPVYQGIDEGTDDEGQRKTGPDGAFEFEGVVPGSHMVTVISVGFESNFEVVEVKAGQRVAGVTILLRPDPYLHADPGRRIGAPRSK